MTHIWDLALIIALFFSASGCGMWILVRGRLKAPGRFQQFLFACGVGLGLIGYVAFALGMLALYQHPVMTVSFLVLLLLGIRGWKYCGYFNFAILRECWMIINRISWPAKIIIAYLMLVAGVNLLAALAPVVGVDELIYRLAAAKLYLLNERLLYIPSMAFHQQPQHVQMIQMWGLILGSESTTQLVQWGMGVLLLLSLVELARHEMPPTWALISGAIFYTYSDVIVLSGRASPDLANGFFMALAVIAWLQWLESGSLRWLFLAGVLAGLFAAGARLPGAYGAISLTLLIFWYGWRHFRWKLTKAAAYGIAVGLLSFLVVLPWYARTYLQTGNPVWPFLGNLLGVRDWTIDAYDLFTANYSHQEIGHWMSLGRILTAPWDLTIRPELFHSGMVGPIVLATLPLSFLIRLPRRLRWLLGSCGALVILWYVSYPRLRAFIPGVAFLSIVAGYLLWKLWLKDLLPRWTRVTVIAFTFIWLLVGLGTTMRFHLRAASVTLGFQSDIHYLKQRLTEPDMGFYWFEDYQVLNEILPEDSRLLIYDTRGYHLNFDYDYYSLVARRTPDSTRLLDLDFVTKRVHELGTDYVLLWPEPQHGDEISASNLLEHTLHTLCGSHWPIIYHTETMIACQVTSETS